MKNEIALVRERWDGLSDAVPVPRLARRYALVAALAGELLGMVALFACDKVPPALVRSLQLFLRF